MQPGAVPPISELGPDAWLEPMAVDEFHKLLSKKNLGIKALLLDQVKKFAFSLRFRIIENDNNPGYV